MAARFIGSSISLISKSDIRYCGVLHSIDPQAATVSLEKVRSLGTEGRKGNPAEEVPASDNVYDFIVFRASDVKDLQIEAPAAESTPADPAIVGTAAPAAAPAPAAATPQAAPASPPKPAEQPAQQLQPPAPGAPGPHSPFAPPPPHLGGAGSPFAPYPPPFPPSPFGAPPGPFGPYGAPYPPFGAPGPFGPPGPGGPFGGPPPPFGGQLSPPAQPQQQGVKSPAAASAVAPSPAVQNATAPSPAAAPAAAPATPNDTRPTTNGAAAAPASPAKAAAAVPKQAADIEQLAKDMSRANLGQPPRPPQQQQQQGGRREDGVGASIFSGPQHSQPARQNHPGRPLQAYGANPGKQAVPLPAGEFDFEKANAAFEKPHALPAAPAAEEGESPISAPANGAAPTGGDDEFVVPPPPEEYYNPNKSFFDTISSDSKTRTDPAQQNAMGRYGGMGGGGYGGGRYDRAKERERNMEAFGESGAGMGRGPGGGRRGPGGGGRGRRGPGGGQQQQGGERQQGGGGGGYGRQNYGQRQQQ
ncbi:hypothetical protein JCM6882_009436 [Rhodosporidiobolus microsporus]